MVTSVSLSPMQRCHAMREYGWFSCELFCESFVRNSSERQPHLWRPHSVTNEIRIGRYLVAQWRPQTRRRQWDKSIFLQPVLLRSFVPTIRKLSEKHYTYHSAPLVHNIRGSMTTRYINLLFSLAGNQSINQYSFINPFTADSVKALHFAILV